MAPHQDNRTSQTGEQRYRHLFENAPLCIFVIDLTVSPPTIQEINRRAELVYGYPAAELVGMPADRLAPEEAQPAILTTIQRVQQGQTVTTETTSRHRDGTRFWVRMIAAPDPAEDGHMIVTVEDITPDKERRSEAEAIDSERRRIAHEIHDGVAQSLAGLRFKSALWSHRADVPPAMRAALDEMQTVLASAIADLRRAIFSLRPLNLEAVGFNPALAQLVADFGDQHQLAAQLDVSGPQDALPTAYELPLFRVIQQGLNNIGQHAHASSALVRLAVDADGGGVTVSVRDNGRGFDPSRLGPANRAGHFGLRQMRERILSLGGTLDVRSAIGQGTELLITLPPLAKKAPHAAD